MKIFSVGFFIFKNLKRKNNAMKNLKENSVCAKVEPKTLPAKNLK
jgi:hypothetical protein